MMFDKAEYNKTYRARHLERLKARRRELYQLNRDKEIAQARQWQASNVERYRDNQSAYVRGKYAELRAWLDRILAGLWCSSCGESRSECLDFHHRDPEEKVFKISGELQSKGIEAITAEIDKCDVLCANCHRIHHDELQAERLAAEVAPRYSDDRAAYQRYHNRKSYRKRRQYFSDLKRELKCMTCDESRPGCLSFHHRDPATKSFTVAEEAHKRPRQEILDEIAKCDVLCENCHRAYHHGKRSLIIANQ